MSGKVGGPGLRLPVGMAALRYAVLFSSYLFLGTRMSENLFFFLPFGQYVEAHGVPHEMFFSVFAGEHFPFVMQQWLFDLVIWKVYQAFGFTGCFALGLAMGMALLWALYRLFSLVSGGNEMLPLLLAIACGWTLEKFDTVRPDYLSLFFLVTEVLLLEQARRKHGTLRWAYALLPLFSLLTVNLHAAMWPMLLVLLLPYLAESLAMRLPALSPYFSAAVLPCRACVLLLAETALAGLANPYGTPLMLYGLRFCGAPDLLYVSKEMWPLLRVSPALFVLMLGFLAVLCGLGLRRRLPLAYFLLALGTGFMGVLAYRSLVLSVIFSSLLLCAVCRKSLLLTLSERLHHRLLIPLGSVFCAAMLVLFAGRAGQFVSPVFPHCAEAILQDMQAEGREGEPVFTTGWVGDYLYFRGMTPYLIGADEAFTQRMTGTRSILAEYHAVSSLEIPYESYFDSFGFGYVVTIIDTPLYDAIEADAHYHKIYDTQSDPSFGLPGFRIYRRGG